MTNMINSIRQYIKLCLLDEYGSKDFYHGYSLDVTSIPKKDQEDFLLYLFKNDEALKELVLNYMQELIDENLDRIEQQDKYNAGLRPIIDRINGEVTWIGRRIA